MLRPLSLRLARIWSTIRATEVDFNHHRHPRRDPGTVEGREGIEDERRATARG